MSRAGISIALLMLLVLISCAMLSHYQGIGRIRRYEINDARLPEKFDGFTIAFISDTHYPSKFTSKRLGNAVRAIFDLSPDLLLFGGDYVEDDAYIDELFSALGRYNPPHGKYAILGNHDAAFVEKLEQSMSRNNIMLLADTADTLRIDGSQIYLCGVKDYGSKLQKKWLKQYADSGFTILLAHSPDYVQNADIENISLTLSGHTHGGQVTLLGLYAPVTNSSYGRRFLSGLNYTDKGVPVVTSNGLGTSRQKLRFCAPSDIIFVTLRRK